MHRVRRGQIVIDFIYHSLLGRSYRKRQRTNETLLQLSPDFVANAGVVEFKCTLATNQYNLHAQQFVKCQTTTRVLLGHHRFRKVNRP